MSGVNRLDRFEALKHLTELLERSIASDEDELARGWGSYRKDVTPIPAIPVELQALYLRLEAKKRHLRKFSGELYGTSGDWARG
jgi:hypothetical protein